MEFEYALIRRTYDILIKIIEDFEANNKLGRPRWLNFKKTPQYPELKALLSNDIKLMTLYFCADLGWSRVVATRLRNDGQRSSCLLRLRR